MEFSQTTSRSRIVNRRFRSSFCSSSVGNRSGWAEGSSTSDDHSTARAAANGRRAHHRCKVEGWPCRIDFSRAEALLIASKGSAASISFFRKPVPWRLMLSLSLFQALSVAIGGGGVIDRTATARG